jgi:hypothetical protein
MTDIVTRDSKVPVAFGVPMSSLDEAYRLSQNLSLSMMLPSALRGKPADVLAMLLYGQELGLGPMQSIQTIYVVEGRPSLSAQLWRALVRRAGHKFRVLERVRNTSCTIEIERCDDPGHPHVETFTLDDAIQLGKVSLKDGKPYSRSQQGKPLPWETVTDDMLFARATARGCRAACPEVALGFYADDEAADLEPVTVSITPEIPKGDEPEDAEVVDDDKTASEVAELQQEFGEGWPPAEDLVDADA